MCSFRLCVGVCQISGIAKAFGLDQAVLWVSRADTQTTWTKRQNIMTDMPHSLPCVSFTHPFAVHEFAPGHLRGRPGLRSLIRHRAGASTREEARRG